MNEILESLEPLFKKAENGKLWFYTPYQNMWFSPNELKTEQEKGKFVWGSENWELRNPQEYIDQLENQIRSTKKAIERFKIRIETN